MVASASAIQLFPASIGGNRLRRWFIDTHVRAKARDTIIDIGCGPGEILPWLPPVEYIGFDVNGSYIAAAQHKYGDRGTFVVGDTRAILGRSAISGGGHCHWIGYLASLG
jgi:SAM-dependent methyltransferase